MYSIPGQDVVKACTEQLLFFILRLFKLSNIMGSFCPRTRTHFHSLASELLTAKG